MTPTIRAVTESGAPFASGALDYWLPEALPVFRVPVPVPAARDWRPRAPADVVDLPPRVVEYRLLRVEDRGGAQTAVYA